MRKSSLIVTAATGIALLTSCMGVSAAWSGPAAPSADDAAPAAAVQAAEDASPAADEAVPATGQAAPSEDAEDEAAKTASEPTAAMLSVEFVPYAGEHGSMFLAPGDAVAVISPSALPSRAQVDATVAGLREWGYVPVEGKHVCEECRTLQDCVDDLAWALEDPSIKAVFCVRGGYAASEVADALSPELVASSGKLIIGYSDITTYHSFWTVAGLPSVHSSMSATFTGLPEGCLEAEKLIIQGQVPAYTCEADEYCVPGEAEGILIGGNLSTLTGVLGTSYDCTKIDQPYILFLEDVEEDMQHVHRYLTVLDHLGVLDGAAGIVFGEWTDVPVDMGDYDGRSRGGRFESVADMISREFLQGRDIPVAFGFPAGHGDENYPLLMGETVHLTVGEDAYSLAWE